MLSCPLLIASSVFFINLLKTKMRRYNAEKNTSQLIAYGFSGADVFLGYLSLRRSYGLTL